MPLFGPGAIIVPESEGFLHMDRMLPRCTPEEAGIASKTLEDLLDALEETGTEMHGLMIARHGKVCAEGWWAPYAPNLVHGDQSLTKTYTITALGLLHDEGKLELEEKLVDIFPQYMPEVISENLQAMTVRNLMSFGSGVEQMVSIADADWLRRFFALPVTNPPGSSFFYSGVCTAVGGAIVRERTGMGLIAYLTPRLFDKIGIDASHIKTIYTGDGLEYGGGGFFTTTEDNLRLMLLYARGGLWDGERVLSGEWCREVTSKQIDTASEAAGNPGVTDNFMGYGLQCWMCKPHGAYRADGAMGQFAIVVPSSDLVISINETADQSKLQHQKVLDTIWTQLLPHVTDEPLPPNPDACAHLTTRLRSLCLPRPLFTAVSSLASTVSSKTYQLAENSALLLPAATFMAYGLENRGIRDFSLVFSDADTALLHWTQKDAKLNCRIGLSGNDAVNQGRYGPAGLKWLHASGGWESPDTFCFRLRMVESCFSKTVRIRFEAKGCMFIIEAPVANPGEPVGTMEIPGVRI